MVQVIDLKKEIKDGREKLERIETETLKYIKELNLDEIDKALLEMRYVGYGTWKQIAENLNYVESYLWKRHYFILKRIGKASSG